MSGREKAWAWTLLNMCVRARTLLVHETLLPSRSAIQMRSGWRPGPLMLRHVSLYWLVHSCWAHNPEERPRFSRIVQLLKPGGTLDGLNEPSSSPASLPAAEAPPLASASSSGRSAKKTLVQLGKQRLNEVPTLVVDSDKRVTRANRALSTLIGVERRQLLHGRRITSLFSDRACTQLLCSDGSTRNVEAPARVRSGDGGWRPGRKRATSQSRREFFLQMAAPSRLRVLLRGSGCARHSLCGVGGLYCRATKGTG